MMKSFWLCERCTMEEYGGMGTVSMLHILCVILLLYSMSIIFLDNVIEVQNYVVTEENTVSTKLKSSTHPSILLST